MHITHYRDDPEIHPTVKARIQSPTVAPIDAGTVLPSVPYPSAAHLGGFTDSQITLLHTFAEQAVIAITSAETYRASARSAGAADRER